MVDLKAFTGRGYPGKWDEALANVPVAGIDREQAHGAVRLCPETEPVLYGPLFSPTKIRYRRGSRPILERIAAGLAGPTPRDRARSAMLWVAQHVVHPHLTGPLAPDRGFTEEQLIESERGWCNEQARVFIALCEVMQTPARVCFLFHANGVSGHTVAEAYVEGRWVFFDVTFCLWVELPDGRLAEGRELSGPYRHLAHEAYRRPLAEHYQRIQPFVEQFPGWCRKDRPDPDRGGDLLDILGICNYIVDGAERI
jgi:hypothetical protein